MTTGSLRSSTLLVLPWSPGHHACSCRNYKHVIKVSELNRRVSSQLMRSCHMVFIEMRWACREPRRLHHHFLQHARILRSCIHTVHKNTQIMRNKLQLKLQMLCIPAHVTFQVESAFGLFAVGAFSKVICFFPRDPLALSTVAQNWVICIASLTKTYFVWRYLVFQLS